MSSGGEGPRPTAGGRRAALRRLVPGRRQNSSWAPGGATAARPGRTPAQRRGLLLLSTLGLVVVLGLLTWLLYFSSVLAVRQLTVEGVEGNLASSVQERAGISEGMPLARISEDGVRGRVLEDRRLAGLEVERHWPTSVTLVAEPREPALVATGTDGRWYVDATGVAYERSRTPSSKLASAKVAGKVADLSEADLKGLVDLWQLRPDPTPLEGTLGTPNRAADGSITFSIGGLDVVWGTATQTELKWKVVESLIGQESIDPRSGLDQKIDVSDPMRPVVTGIPPAPVQG